MLNKQLQRVRKLIATKTIDPTAVNTPIGVELTKEGKFSILCSVHKVSEPFNDLDTLAKALSKQIDHLICFAVPKLTPPEMDVIKDGTRVLVKIAGEGPILWQTKKKGEQLGFADLGGKFLGVAKLEDTEIWLNI